MKKSSLLFERLPFSKMGYLPFLLTFLFFASLQLDMKAQTHTLLAPPNQPVHAKTINQVPGGNFVSPAVAIQRLHTEMSSLKSQLEQLTEGTHQYKVTMRRYVYYTTIKLNIENGKGVAESINDSLVVIRSTLHDYNANVEDAVVEKAAAINLLKA